MLDYESLWVTYHAFLADIKITLKLHIGISLIMLPRAPVWAVSSIYPLYGTPIRSVATSSTLYRCRESMVNRRSLAILRTSLVA